KMIRILVVLMCVLGLGAFPGPKNGACGLCAEQPMISDDGTAIGIIDNTKDSEGCRVVSLICHNDIDPTSAYLYMNRALLENRNTISAVCMNNGWFLRGADESMEMKPIISIFCSSVML
ncbi:unnamed protein product, partial [Mesorhabditis spiculigera]